MANVTDQKTDNAKAGGGRNTSPGLVKRTPYSPPCRGQNGASLTPPPHTSSLLTHYFSPCFSPLRRDLHCTIKSDTIQICLLSSDTIWDMRHSSVLYVCVCVCSISSQKSSSENDDKQSSYVPYGEWKMERQSRKIRKISQSQLCDPQMQDQK